MVDARSNLDHTAICIISICTLFGTVKDFGHPEPIGAYNPKNGTTSIFLMAIRQFHKRLPILGYHPTHCDLERFFPFHHQNRHLRLKVVLLHIRYVDADGTTRRDKEGSLSEDELVHLDVPSRKHSQPHTRE